MTRDSDFIGLIEGYLDDVEGHTYLPDTTRDAIRARLPMTSQRPAWWPGWRFPEMNTMMKYGLGAAAAVLVALVGFTVLGGAGGFGSPDPTDSPDVLTEPTPTPIELPDINGDLAAGRYFIDDPAVTPARFTLEVPAGWETIEGGFLGKIADRAFYVSVSSWVVDNAYADPCRWVGSEIDPPVGPTVDDLAGALSDQVGRNGSEPSDVTLGGYGGKKVELSVPADFDVTSCDNEESRMWRSLGSAGGYNYGPGQRDTVYIVDVDGERLVIHTTYLPRASEEDLTELDAVVDSIRIDPGGPDATGLLSPTPAAPHGFPRG